MGTDGATANNERNSDMGLINSLFSTASYTPGSVLFANAAGKIAQDSINLFWNSTTNRLGIGTPFPATPLHVTTGVGAQFRLSNPFTPLTITDFQSIANGLNISVHPESGVSATAIRLFADTLTSGAILVQVYNGAASPLVNAQIGTNGAATYFAAVNGAVGIGTNSIDACAILEIESTTQGVLLPRMNNAQRDAIPFPLPGLMIFNSQLNVMQYRNNGSPGLWMTITATPTVS